MRISLPFYSLIIFVSLWVIGDVSHATYIQNLWWAILMTLCFLYFNNAHKLIHRWIKIHILKFKTL